MSAACVGGKQQASAEDKARLAAYILDAPPPDAKKVDVNFENKIHLVGYKLEPPEAGPGKQVKITYYWRCDEPIEEGWQLFTHVQHEGFDKVENLDQNGPLRQTSSGGHQVLGPDRWERGKVYADEQTFTMPMDLRGPDTMIYVGIYKGDARLRILSGPNDGDNRAIVAKVKTGVAPRKEEPHRSPSDVPSVEVMKLPAGERIVVDGKADDKAWASAATVGPFVDVGTGRPAVNYPVNGAAKMTWDDEALYVVVEVHDPDVTGYFTDKESQPKSWTAGGQPMTWTKDTAEIMVDPDGDGDNKDYYEIQINPQNKSFHSQFDSYNTPKTEPLGPFGHEDWDPKMTTAVVVHGTIDNPADKDQGYTVEAAIPWKAFAKGAKQLPPKPGDTWRMNFYAMENNGGTAWSPILGQGNFHKATRFGRVTWVTKEWVAAQQAGDGGAVATASDGGTTTTSATIDAGRPLRHMGDAGHPGH